MRRWPKTLPILILLLGVNTFLFYNRYYSASYYDSSPELQLAKVLADENSLVSQNWYYSTEIRVLGTQIVNSLLFHLTSDWRLVATIGNVVQAVLLCATYVFFSKKVFGERGVSAGLVGAIFMLLPVTWIWRTYVLEWNYYIPHFVITLLAISLYLQTVGESEATVYDMYRFPNILWIVAQCALAVLACVGGVRHLEITYVPLLLAAITLVVLRFRGEGEGWREGEGAGWREGDAEGAGWREEEWRRLAEGRWREEDSGASTVLANAIPVVLATLSAVIGYVINSKALVAHYRFSSYEQLKWGSFQLGRVEKVVNALLQNFGFSPDVGLLSMEGIASGVALVLLCLCVWLINVSLRRRSFTFPERFVLLFAAYSWGVNLFILLLTDCSVVPRYLLPQVMLLWPVGQVLHRRMERPRTRGPVCAVVVACVVFLSLVGYGGWIKVERNSPELRELVSFLRDEGYVQAYGSFYTGDVIPALSDGAIDFYCVDDFGKLTPNRWLMKIEQNQHVNSHVKSFVILTEQEYNDVQGMPYFAAGTVVQVPGYVAITYEDDTALWQAVG